MEHVIWRHGEPIEQSERIKVSDKKMPSQSTSETYSQTPTNLALEEIEYNKDRESMNDKINERCLIKQLGQNPFLTGSYIDDLNVQDQFLRPKSSHTDNNARK